MLSKILQTNKNARKIFGDKEIEIIQKQLEGIALTQSEKNRLSRDIRPKFNFIKDASKFSEEFDLKKALNKKKIISKVIDLILKDELKNKIKAILLFGSMVNGIVTPRSDIDICVVFTKIDLNEATRFRIRISSEFSDKLDIQVFNILPQKIKREIARKHNILYKNQDFDNINFTTRFLKDKDYFIRMENIFGETV